MHFDNVQMFTFLSLRKDLHIHQIFSRDKTGLFLLMTDIFHGQFGSSFSRNYLFSFLYCLKPLLNMFWKMSSHLVFHP